MNNKNVRNIVLCGFGIAVVFVLTYFVAIPIGQFGYVNLGDAGVMLFASIFNPALGFVVGGIGSALADIMLGYSQYALFTLIIKGIEGALIGFAFVHFKGKIRLISYVLGFVWMVFGYYLTDAFLSESFYAALTGVGFNFMQGLISCIVATIALVSFGQAASKFFIDKN